MSTQTTDTTTSKPSSTNAEKTNNKNYSREGILKKELGNENIPNIGGTQPNIHKEKIEGTPFEIVTQEGIGCWLTLGAFRLSAPTEDKQELYSMVNSRDWELIANLIQATVVANNMQIAQYAMEQEKQLLQDLPKVEDVTKDTPEVQARMEHLS